MLFSNCFWKSINVTTQAFMKIKRIEIVPIRPFEGLIAFANVVLEEGLYLGSIGVHRKLDGGFRITFPSKKVGKTNFCIYHPINLEVGERIRNGYLLKSRRNVWKLTTIKKVTKMSKETKEKEKEASHRTIALRIIRLIGNDNLIWALGKIWKWNGQVFGSKLKTV